MPKEHRSDQFKYYVTAQVLPSPRKTSRALECMITHLPSSIKAPFDCLFYVSYFCSDTKRKSIFTSHRAAIKRAIADVRSKVVSE